MYVLAYDVIFVLIGRNILGNGSGLYAMLQVRQPLEQSAEVVQVRHTRYVIRTVMVNRM